MKIKPALLALALIFAPLSALAEGCHDDARAISCSQGTTWDPEKGQCVVQPSS